MWSRLGNSWTRFGTQYPNARRSVSALIWLPATVWFTQEGYSLKLVRGRSMQPTLNPPWSSWRDLVVFDRNSVLNNDFKRGDIIALQSPIEADLLLVKRIVAVEGDTVSTLEPYPDSTVVVPPRHIWVEGDERHHSDDSNLFGPVPCGLVRSKLTYIVWPMERAGPLRPPKLSKDSQPHGPTWRREMAALEQEAWRRRRVVIPADSTHGISRD